MGTTRSSTTERGKGRKGREAHHKDASVLGEDGGGPEQSDFTSEFGDVEDEFIASIASRLDSLNRDDADDDADLQDALAWRREHCNGGALSAMARWFSVVLRELFGE
jgi:hypothetical protein